MGALTTAVASALGNGTVCAAELDRTPTMIRRDGVDVYQLWLPGSGKRLAMAQDGRQAELRPGDFALADLTRPLSLRARAPGRVMTLLVPRPLLPLPPEQVAQVTGVALSGQEGTGALLGRPVEAIAARWGFPDATSFNRLFRSLHGSPPGEYRAMRPGRLPE